jgi:hypothetical protein
LVEVTVQNKKAGAYLEERLLENHQRLNDYGLTLDNKNKKLNQMNKDVTFLFGRELYKKNLYFLIILLFGLVDFCLLLRKFKIL